MMSGQKNESHNEPRIAMKIPGLAITLVCLLFSAQSFAQADLTNLETLIQVSGEIDYF